MDQRHGHGTQGEDDCEDPRREESSGRHGASSHVEVVCDILEADNAAGAQTKRRGGDAPVRLLLGGEDSPAALLVRALF
jgi:hypothetical protein